MGRPKRRTLTATGVARVRPPDDPGRRRMDWDAVVPGLALRTTATGAKSWVVVTRLHAKVVFVTLGKHGALTLQAARDLARTKLEAVARGDDPRVPKRPVRSPETFAAVAAEYLRLHARAKKRTWQEDQRMLSRYVLPHLGTRLLRDITRADLSDLVHGMVTWVKNDRGEEVAGPGGIQANRTAALLGKLFNWCVDTGKLDTSPAYRLVKPASETVRSRVLTDNEVKRLWAAWSTMAYPWGNAFKLILLTATRRGEVAAVEWQELDLDAGLWTLPETRVKSKLALLLPLPETAVALLRAAPRVERCPYVFTTRGKRPIGDWSGAVAEASELAGVTGWSAHDLRRTARTGFSKLRVPADLAERLMGHVLPGVRKHYDLHDYVDEKRDALDRWAAHLMNVVVDG